MTAKDRKQLKKALDLFPKIVKEKKEAAKQREKILKNFESLSKQLKKMGEVSNKKKKA